MKPTTCQCSSYLQALTAQHYRLSACLCTLTYSGQNPNMAALLSHCTPNTFYSNYKHRDGKLSHHLKSEEHTRVHSNQTVYMMLFYYTGPWNNSHHILLCNYCFRDQYKHSSLSKWKTC